MAVSEFWEYVESMREERVKRTIPAEYKLGDKQYWHPKYTDQQILDMYYKEQESLGPVLGKLTEADIDDLISSWDANEVTLEEGVEELPSEH